MENMNNSYLLQALIIRPRWNWWEQTDPEQMEHSDSDGSNKPDQRQHKIKEFKFA